MVDDVVFAHSGPCSAWLIGWLTRVYVRTEGEACDCLASLHRSRPVSSLLCRSLIHSAFRNTVAFSPSDRVFVRERTYQRCAGNVSRPGKQTATAASFVNSVADRSRPSSLIEPETVWINPVRGNRTQQGNRRHQTSPALCTPITSSRPIGCIACAQNFSDSCLHFPGILNPFCCTTLLASEWSHLQRTREQRYFTFYVFTENFLFSLGDRVPRVTHGTYGLPESSSQTASRSVQAFLYESQMLCCTMH